MMLYINGNDIERVSLGLLDRADQAFRFTVGPTDIPAMPENYLGIIDGFLQAHDAPLEKLEGIVVVSGEGSATALRSSHAIVNALGFARGIPLYTSLDHVPDQPTVIALPTYASVPQVTVTKKDALKRRT
jgi:hypothetical protein